MSDYRQITVSCVMPLYHRSFTPGHLQFITTSAYRRTPLFRDEGFCREFVSVLADLRGTKGFTLTGWVLMPDHFHLLLRTEPADAVRTIIKLLKQQTAFRILSTLRDATDNLDREELLERLRLPPTVHDESTYRVWQRRFYPFNIYTERKRSEKLNYMHNNPVKRGLVAHPGEWPWSSWRFYFLGDASVLAMDRLA